jgi:hypothetical protein
VIEKETERVRHREQVETIWCWRKSIKVGSHKLIRKPCRSEEMTLSITAGCFATIRCSLLLKRERESVVVILEEETKNMPK